LSRADLGLGQANSLFGSFPHSPHLLSFSPIHSHLPLAFLCGCFHTPYLWPVHTYRNKQACPPAANLRTNGSSHPHNPSSSNNTLLSRSYPTVSFDEPHTLSTAIDQPASEYRHVGCREKQSRRWSPGGPAPETTQCLDPLSLRQAPRTAPSPSGPAETDPGGGVQDHLGAMASRERRRARHVRTARRDGQGGTRAIVPQLSLRAHEDG
jgi:hypothetical protein